MGVLLKFVAVVLFFMVAGMCLYAGGPEIKADNSSMSGRQTASVNISSIIPDIPVNLSLKEAYVPEVQMDMQDHSHLIVSGARNPYAGRLRKGGEELTVCSGEFRDYLAVRHFRGFYVLFLKKLII